MKGLIKSHISTLQEIVNRHFTSEVRNSFNEQLELIDKKSKSSQLHLAVVGEFSSGKSTFINAILRRRLLKEAVMPTTASATNISKSKPTTIWQKLFSNSKTNLHVSFSCGDKFSVSENNIDILKRYLMNKYGYSFDSIYDIIAALTSEQSIARDVRVLDIYIKNEYLPDSITIIDTPGFNPGEESVENHLEITREVVEKTADLAIVLIPASQAMSSTLKNFLLGNLKKYLHRCIFVITKMDQVESNERESLKLYVKDNLISLGINNPFVCCVSAWTMLPVKSIPYAFQEEWTIWQEKFKLFENDIWKKLNESRTIVLHEHAYRLLDHLAKKLQEELNEVRCKINETIRILNENTVVRIQELTNKILQNETKKLDIFYSSINTNYGYYINTAISESFIVISSGGKLRMFKSVEGPKIECIIKDLIKFYTNNIIEKQAESNSIINYVISNFRREFDSHYKDMPSLNPNHGNNIVANLGNNTKLSIEDANSVLFGENFKHAGKTLGSAAVGAGLGTLIFPGVGTIIGGIIGGLAGLFGFGPSESEIQNKVKIEIEKTIREHFDTVKNLLDSNLNNCKKQQVLNLEQYCQKHIKEYGKRVEKLIAQQTSEKQLQSNKLNEVNKTIVKIQELKIAFEEEMLNLKLINK